MPTLVLTEEMRNEWLAKFPSLPLPDDNNDKLRELWNLHMYSSYKGVDDWIKSLLRHNDIWSDHLTKDEFVLSLCEKGLSFFSRLDSLSFLLDLHQVLPDFYSAHKDVVDTLINDLCEKCTGPESRVIGERWLDDLPHLPLPKLDQRSILDLWIEDCSRYTYNCNYKYWIEKLLDNPSRWSDYTYREEFLLEFCQKSNYWIKNYGLVLQLLEIATSFPSFYARYASVVDYAIDRLKVERSPEDFIDMLEKARIYGPSDERQRVVLNMFGHIVCSYYDGQPITNITQLCPKITGKRGFSVDFVRSLRKKFTEACTATRAENQRRAKITEKETIDKAFSEVITFWQKHAALEPAKDWRNFEHSVLKKQVADLELLTQRENGLGTERDRILRDIDPTLRTRQLNKMIEFWRKLQEKERKAAAKKEAEEEARQERLEKLFEESKQNLELRCNYIVNVFNALMDLDIDDDAVINSGMIERIGSIHSRIGIGLSFRQTYTQTFDFHTVDGDRTWLELESENIETDFRDTIASANLLVWHELCHLADPKAIKQFLGSAVLPKTEDNDSSRQHAVEVIIDGLAMNMGMSFYVHPDPGQPIPRRDVERQEKMYESHAAMGRRIVSYLGEKELSPAECAFVTRFIAELDVHCANGSKEAKKAQRKMLSIFGEKLGSYQTLRETYAKLYIKVLFWPGIASLKFYSSLSEMEEDEAEFIGESPTIH